MQGPYSEKVMDHFMHPRNVGDIPDADGTGHVGNSVCGDIMELYIKVKDDVILDAKFKTFGCLPVGEKIVLSEGRWKEISDLTKGSTVVNSNGRETLASDLFTRSYSGRLFKITPFVSPFNSFCVTPNHPILSIKRSRVIGARRYGPKCDWLRVERTNLFSAEPDFVRADNLSEGDYLVFNVNRHVRDNSFFTKQIMRLLGYYLSEGYITAGGSVAAFAFNKKEKKLIKEVKTILRLFVGKKAKTRIRGHTAEVYICSRQLVRFLTAHCGKMARKKTLSKEILLLPFWKQWELIQTYLAGDGDTYRRRPHNSKTYRITTTSEPLAIQVQVMLARGRIFASIRQMLKTNCYIVDRRLKDSIQYLIAFKLDRLHRFVHDKNKYFLVPIKKIDIEDFKGAVYNFQVHNEPNTYLVKGFAVHNCGAAIATSSMVTELVKGKTIKDALEVSNSAVAEALGGLPKIKMHCSVLAEQALKSAIVDYLKKHKRLKEFPQLAGYKPDDDLHEHQH